MVNGKSFVIAEEPVAGLRAVQLYNGKVLNLSDGVFAACSADKRYVLIGECWSVKEDEDPSEYLSASNDLTTEKILERENYWCGRYILILGDIIYMDAAGTMSVYYHDKYLSNSLNVIRELLGMKLKNEKLYDGLSLDFVPGSKTQYDGIRRLLPSMVYDLHTKTVGTRTLLPEFSLTFSSDEERRRVFVDEFAAALKNMDKHFAGKKKLIALTGGRDSRNVLAVSEYAGLKFDTFTLEHDSISNGDIEIPARMTLALGRKHYYIRRDKSRFQRSRAKDFDRHICNYEKGADRDFYACGQFEELRRQAGGDIVLLRASVWGIAIDYYAQYIRELDYEKLAELFPLIRYNPIYEESVKEWLGYAAADTENTSINPPDRIFWELREGCWLSTIEGCFDIYEGIVSIQPVNCRRLISLLLGFDLQDRIKKLHENKIAAYACPQLKDIPYDYQMEKGGISRGKQVAGYLKKSFWLLKNFGPGGLVFFIKNKFSGRE